MLSWQNVQWPHHRALTLNNPLEASRPKLVGTSQISPGTAGPVLKSPIRMSLLSPSTTSISCFTSSVCCSCALPNLSGPTVAKGRKKYMFDFTVPARGTPFRFLYHVGWSSDQELFGGQVNAIHKLYRLSDHCRLSLGRCLLTNTVKNGMVVTVAHC